MKTTPELIRKYLQSFGFDIDLNRFFEYDVRTESNSITICISFYHKCKGELEYEKDYKVELLDYITFLFNTK